MGPILVIGRSDDRLCEQVIDDVRGRGHEAFFLKEDQLFPGLNIDWTPGESGSIGQGEWEVPLEDLSGVLCRSFGVPVSPEDFATKDGQYVSAEWFALVMALTQHTKAKVINRLQPSLWYKLKLSPVELLTLAPDCGFKLPRTMVSTRAEDVRTFCAQHSATYAPLTHPVRYPIRTSEDVDRLLALGEALPFQLTEVVDGEQTSVVVVDKDVVAITPEGELHEIQHAGLRERCAKLGVRLGLTFFEVSLAGEYFLGLDRSPTFFECTEAAQREVARRVSNALVEQS